MALGSWGGQRPSLADYVMGTGLTDGATAPPEVLDLRENRSNSHIPNVFPHRFPANSHVLRSEEGTGTRRDGAGDSNDVYLEGEASRFRRLLARTTRLDQIDLEAERL